MKTSLGPRETRREGIAARSIKLSDGLDWGFALPSRLIRPRILTSSDEFGRTVETMTVEIDYGYLRSIRDSIDRLRIATGTDDIADQYQSFLSLAIKLLLRVHDIDAAKACELLTLDDTAFSRIIIEVMNILELDDSRSEEISEGREKP